MVKTAPTRTAPAGRAFEQYVNGCLLANVQPSRGHTALYMKDLLVSAIFFPPDAI